MNKERKKWKYKRQKRWMKKETKRDRKREEDMEERKRERKNKKPGHMRYQNERGKNISLAPSLSPPPLPLSLIHLHSSPAFN